MKIKIVYCPDCEKYVDATVIQKKESYTIKGDGPFTITANVPICPKCNAELYDKEIESNNQKMLYDQYRKKHGLLLPEEIKAIREMYCLSQKSFSRLLGLGEITIHRYESGSVQNESHDNLIREARNPEFVKELYSRRPDAVSSRERKGFEERLNELLSIPPQVRDNWAKVANAVLFFASELKAVYKTKLCKLLWYADMLHYKYHSCSITGLTYAKLEYGPAPEDRDKILKAMLQKGLISITLRIFDEERGIAGEEITAKQPAQEEVFSEEELNTLKFVVQKFSTHTAREISQASHAEEAYKSIPLYSEIPYDLARTLSIDLPDKNGGTSSPE